MLRLGFDPGSRHNSEGHVKRAKRRGRIMSWREASERAKRGVKSRRRLSKMKRTVYRGCLDSLNGWYVNYLKLEICEICKYVSFNRYRMQRGGRRGRTYVLSVGL